MANTHTTLKSLFDDIADSIREKNGNTNTIVADNFPNAIRAISTGSDVSGVTATAADVLSPKVFVDSSGKEVTGTIATKTSSDLTASGATVSVPVGYYSSTASKSVATATQATPSISVSSAGLITASSTQTAGYVAAGTKNATNQLTVQAAKTVTPSSSSQTAVAAGRYTTGAITVAAIPSSYTQLNFTVVGGTSQPSNPVANTIWVNTSTSITSWVFDYNQPTASAGCVWIQAGNGPSNFNALKTNSITLRPSIVKQYIGSEWVVKTAYIYQNNAFTQISQGLLYLYKNGDTYADVTGGYSTMAKSYNGNFTATAPTLAYNTNNMSSMVSYRYKSGILHATNKIDLSSIKKLTFKGSAYTGQDSFIQFTVWSSFGSTTTANRAAYFDIVGNNVSHTLNNSLDVSSLTGSYYIGFVLCSGYGGSAELTVTELYGEG